jgi:asparagine synthase (glutamine-hydrolysing)
LSFDFKAKRFVNGAELDLPNSHFYWRVVLSEDAKSEIMRSDGAYAASDQLFVEAFDSCNAEDELNRLLYIDYSYHLPDDLMIKNDRMTMAHSLEARVPFTDNELVAYLATVPVDYKLKGMQKKYLLRAAFRGVLPDQIINKKKVGLEMPYSNWFMHEWRDMVESVLSEKKLEATGLFNGRAVRELWEAHLAKKVDHGRAIWGLLNYMLWHELYIEKGTYASYLSPPRPARTGTER